MGSVHIIEMISDIINSVMTVYFFNRTLAPKNEKYEKVYSLITIIFYTLIQIIIQNEMLTAIRYNKKFIFIMFCYILLIIYPLFLREGRISEKIFLSLFYVNIIIIITFSIFITISMTLGLEFNEVLIYVNDRRVLVTTINRFIRILVIFIFFNKMKFIKYIKSKFLYILGIILILNLILNVIIQKKLIRSLDIINSDIIYIVFSFSAIQILLIIMVNLIFNQTEKRIMLEMSLEDKLSNKEVMDMYTKMMGWKHDFKNHISTIKGLLELGTEKEVISYIDEMNERINDIDNKIYTDNVLINSILVNKLKVTKKYDIKIDLNIRINKKINISNIDICVILGNLLDNSIEACIITEGYKYIDLNIISENNRLIIKISNTTNGKLKYIDGKFLSTKNKGIHGIGLSQVDEVVKKYNGYINRKHENNIFTTYLMIQNN
ncbi:sensor histidine kinase [uncultured Clostridium sp.]|uniref:sensor histidine kinase n=4 Tax=uncultured Clostridium sp. TaxID=59620 RepID=UPI002634BCC4|nr:GHKL domain-containing protein [uncultured Clostridium sp.]